MFTIKAMKLSVVIPAHNEERYIGACLTSLQASIKALPADIECSEIIVVNSNSTDATGTIARSYGVTVIDEPRKGANQARQTGYLAVGDCDVIAFFDADVKVDVQWFLNVARYYQRNPRLVSVSGPYTYYDAGF